MEFNKDCVRDILMYVEKYNVYETNNLGYRALHIVNFDELCKSDSIKYENDTIQYTLKLMEKHHLITFTNSTTQGYSTIDDGYINYSIEEITNYGRKILDNIKNPDYWNEMKSAMEKANMDDCSLDMYYEYIHDVIRKRLDKQN